MALCACGKKREEEATGIRRGRGDPTRSLKRKPAENSRSLIRLNHKNGDHISDGPALSGPIFSLYFLINAKVNIGSNQSPSFALSLTVHSRE